MHIHKKFKYLTKLYHNDIIPSAYYNEHFNMVSNKLITDCMNNIDKDKEFSDQETHEDL